VLPVNARLSSSVRHSSVLRITQGEPSAGVPYPVTEGYKTIGISPEEGEVIPVATCTAMEAYRDVEVMLKVLYASGNRRR
jgi:hypothetical protein